MNKQFQILTGAICLLGWLLLIACEGQKTKEPIKLKTCEEVDSSWTDEPFFSEVNNGWVYRSGKMKDGTLYIKKLVYSDTTQKMLCVESMHETSNICSTNDTTFSHYRYISYGYDIIKCDSTCKNGLVYNVSETLTTEIGKEIIEEKILTHPQSKDRDELFLLKKEEVPAILDNAWSIVQRIKPLLDSLEYYFQTDLIFDKNHQFCGAYFYTEALEKDTPPYQECFEQQAYHITYSFTKN